MRAILIPALCLSLLFLLRKGGAKDQSQNHILPYSNTHEDEMMIKSSDELVIRRLGQAQKDVTLWNSEYRNGSFVIRVQIDESYKSQSKKKIRTALKNLEKRSKVIKFRISSSPPQNNQPYIHIKQTGEGCWSWIGRTRGAKEGQELSLDEDSFCIKSSTIEHEVLHALGFLHEHTRQDRDSYIKINWDNVREGAEQNLQKDKNGDTLGTEYDIDSVMHYGKDTFAKNGKNTMEGINGGTIQNNIMQASYNDLQMVRLLYQCKTGPRTLSQLESNPCTPDCLCWINKKGCKGTDSLCRGDTICQNDTCVKRPKNHPTRAPTPSTKSIVKEHNGNFYEAPGFMFDVKAKSKPLVITNLFLTLAELEEVSNIEVYTKSGSHLSFSEKSTKWEGPIGQFSMNGDGKYSPRVLSSNSITPQRIGSGNTRAFYITSKNSRPFYVTQGSNYSNKNKPLVQNSDLMILEGCSLRHKFNNHWGECKNSRGGESYNLWGGFEYNLED